MQSNSFSISYLSLQELGYVLAKLNQNPAYISQKLNDLMTFSPFIYEADVLKRAIELANQIGFKDFNDCIHTPIDENHCTDFYTYNRADFIRIQEFTSLNIHIL